MSWRTRRGVRVWGISAMNARGKVLVVALTSVAAGFAFASLWLSPDDDPSVRVSNPRAGAVVSLSASSEEPGGKLAPVAAGPLDSTLGPVRRPPPAAIFESVPASREAFEHATSHLEREPSPDAGAPWNPARPVEWVQPPPYRSDLSGPLRVEYSMDVELTQQVRKLLKRGRVASGHVIVMEPDTGRILAYVSTDTDNFPATEPYPAASLVKVVTAAAALDGAPEKAREICRYRGSPYRLTPSRVRPPRSGNEMSLERSLATSNNQCFAQLAVNTVGADAMLAAISRFGWLSQPAPGHEAGVAEVGDDDYDLGRLGCGLAGCRITPLHAAQLAGALADGNLVDPWWIERVVDVHGRSLPLPSARAPRRIMRSQLSRELREMLVRTTTRGTARGAFRDRRGRNRLGDVRVAGKTGNLSGDEPRGRYEWFIGVAPAEAPTVAVAVLQLQSDLWWVRSSELGADVLSTIFCEKRDCRPDLAGRYTKGPRVDAAVSSESQLGG